MFKKQLQRLPKRFARNASPDTKRFVKRVMNRKRKHAGEKRRRMFRRTAAMLTGMRAAAIRWIAVFVIASGIVAVGFMVFSPIIQVREIKVTRESPRLDIEEVQNTLAPVFGKHLFFLYSFEVASLLREKIPDISEISIGKNYPSQLHVSVSLHPLAARLKIAEPDDAIPGFATGSSIDFLTDRGMYVVSFSAAGTETLPEITLVDWGIRPDPGTRLVNTALLERMKAAELTLLRQFGFEIEERIIFLRAQEFHLRIRGKELWFDMKSPMEEQMERYRAFLKEVGMEGVRMYVDLRVRDKVVYQ